MSPSLLENAGLTRKEAEMYELLLRIGDSPAVTIIRKMSMKRATAYKTLYALEEKGLILKQDKGKIIHFRPEPPTALLAYIKKQAQAYERMEKDIRSLIPQLTSEYILSVEKPVVSTFEGVSGLQEIYEDTLRENKPISAVLQTAEVDPTLYAWLITTYAKKRTKIGLHADVIVSSGKWSETYQKNDQKENRTSLVVPQQLFPFQHEVDIYGNKVAFIHYKKGESLIGIVITHPLIAKTMKAWFDLAWIGAQTLTSSTQLSK